MKSVSLTTTHTNPKTKNQSQQCVTSKCPKSSSMKTLSANATPTNVEAANQSILAHGSVKI